MQINKLSFNQCQRIINNNFGSSIGQSNDKYMPWKEEIIARYYYLLNKQIDKQVAEQHKISKHGTDYRGYRVIAIRHSEGYSFNIYKLDRKTKVFTCTLPIPNLKTLVSMIDSTINTLE